MIGSTNSIWKINGQYEQQVNYTMLYDYGDECEDITGGWSKYYTSADSYYSGGKKALSKYENNIKNSSSVAFREVYSLLTSNLIKTEGYTKVGACASTTANSTQNTRVDLRLVDNAITLWAGNFTARDFWKKVDVKANEFLIGDISEHGNYFAQLAVIGDGSPCSGYGTFHAVFMVKADDWQTLVEKAGITASSIDDILTNSTTLLSNEEAVNFMIKNCTGDFMVSAVANSTFLTALNNSQYKTIIWANEHWAKFLNMVA